LVVKAILERSKWSADAEDLADFVRFHWVEEYELLVVIRCLVRHAFQTAARDAQSHREMLHAPNP
jgi:hypothetical protein